MFGLKQSLVFEYSHVSGEVRTLNSFLLGIGRRNSNTESGLGHRVLVLIILRAVCMKNALIKVIRKTITSFFFEKYIFFQ